MKLAKFGDVGVVTVLMSEVKLYNEIVMLERFVSFAVALIAIQFLFKKEPSVSVGETKLMKMIGSTQMGLLQTHLLFESFACSR